MKFVYVLDITQVSLHQRTQRLIVLKAQSEHMPGKILHWFGSILGPLLEAQLPSPELRLFQPSHKDFFLYPRPTTTHWSHKAART